MIYRLLLLPSALAALVLACGDGSGSSGGGPGSLIYTQLNAVVEFDIATREITPLITSDAASTFLLDPAPSPDGKRLAYILQPPPNVEGDSYDAGSDLWVANRDGSDAHLVFQHAEPNQLVRFPEWEDDQRILAIVQELVTEEGVTRIVYTLERIDTESGERTPVLEDVLAFDLSPDSSQIVYARYAREAGQTLDAARADGAGSRQIVGQEAALTPFQSPRFSPDGATIAFASADQTGARAPVDLVRAGAGGVFQRVRDRSAASVSRCCEAWPVSIWSKIMNGVPQDIWTVEAGGGQPVRVADLKEDLPSLAWSGDGERIYVLGLYGLYEVDLATGVIDRIGEGSFHGQLVWVP